MDLSGAFSLQVSKPTCMHRLGVLLASRLDPPDAAKSIAAWVRFLRWLNTSHPRCGLLVDIKKNTCFGNQLLKWKFHFKYILSIRLASVNWNFILNHGQCEPMWVYTRWNMRAGLPHLWVNEKVNFQLIRWGVGDEQAFSVAHSAKSRGSGKKKKRQWNVEREFPSLPFNLCKPKHRISGAPGQL